MDQKKLTTNFLIVLTNTIGATAILPLLPLFVVEQFQATPLQATLVVAAYYVAQIIAAPWLGNMSDRFGRRPILIISQMGTIASYLMLIFIPQLARMFDGFSAPIAIAGGLVIVYAARLLDGATGGNVSVAEAYASDISDQESRSEALGFIGGAVGLGHILGPLLAVALSGLGLLAPIIGATVLSVATLVLTIAYLDEPLSKRERAENQQQASSFSSANLLRRRPNSLIFAIALLVGIYVAGILSSLSLYTQQTIFASSTPEVIVRNTGMLIIGIGAMVAVSQIFLVGIFSRRLGEQVTIVIGVLFLFLSALIIFFVSSVLSVWISMLLFGLGYGLCWPNLQAILTRFNSGNSTGRLLGLFQAVLSLALILGPLNAGFFMQQIGAFAIFHNGGMLMVVATILAVVLFHYMPPETGTSDELTETPLKFRH